MEYITNRYFNMLQVIWQEKNIETPRSFCYNISGCCRSTKNGKVSDEPDKTSFRVTNGGDR